ncbi:recombinase family protein, partial [Streptomyces mirabilis]|uniref:recombinase family protein n=1 Tax=Streptomyces mirabilis TaxID=68239 RepID=UPI0036D8ECB1
AHHSLTRKQKPGPPHPDTPSNSRHTNNLTTPLVAERLVRTEIKIGYARVSTGGQKLERQIDALTAAGCRKIFSNKKSGKTDLRPELKACHAFLDVGDALVVPSLDRYGRSLQDLINMVASLRERGIGFTSLHENLDTTTPGGRLVFHVFAALPSSSANSLSRAPARAWPPPATCCPTPAAPSPRSPSSSASPRAPSTTTSPTCANSAPSPTSSTPRSGDLCQSAPRTATATPPTGQTSTRP